MKNSGMSPDRVREIAHHRDNAHRSSIERNFDFARMSFLKWVECVKQQNKIRGGALESELQEAENEYGEFAKTDPLFLNTCNAILPVIQSSPGILQTELYKRLPQISKSTLSYALYFAAAHGRIIRETKGRTFMLTIS